MPPGVTRSRGPRSSDSSSPVASCSPRRPATSRTDGSGDASGPSWGCRQRPSAVGAVLTVDPQAAEPPFEQIRRQVIERVRSGELPSGTRLPTVRRLAGDLGVAPNTVARAYRELEASGIVRSRGRGGTSIATTAETVAEAGLDAARQYAATVRRLGIPADEAVRVLQCMLAPGAHGST